MRLVQHAVNQGPIIAVVNGMKAASHEILFTFCASQHPIDQILRSVELIRMNEADIVFGVRESLPRTGEGEKLIACCTGCSNATTGFRAMKKEHCQMFDGEFAYGGLFILRAKKKGYRVLEQPLLLRRELLDFPFTPEYIKRKSMAFIVVPSTLV